VTAAAPLNEKASASARDAPEAGGSIPRRDDLMDNVPEGDGKQNADRSALLKLDYLGRFRVTDPGPPEPTLDLGLIFISDDLMAYDGFPDYVMQCALNAAVAGATVAGVPPEALIGFTARVAIFGEPVARMSASPWRSSTTAASRTGATACARSIEPPKGTSAPTRCGS
jgi:hypothetical protein